MTLYKITVEEYTGENSNGYDTWRNMYQQVLEADTTIVSSVVRAALGYETEYLKREQSSL